MKSNGVPHPRTEQAILVLLVAEPPIQAVFVEGVPALPPRHWASDVGIAQQYAMVADLLERLLADAAVEKDGVTDPTRHCVPFGHTENTLVCLHL